MVGADDLGRGYLEHLTEADLRVFARAAEPPATPDALRLRPAAVPALLERPHLFERVYGPGGTGLIGVSPFFAFTVAVHRAAREIADTPYVAERSAPRQQVPVFDAAQLADFLADPWHRLFLAELLASFVRVASGRYRVRVGHRWRAQRYSELDPVRLAHLAAQAPPAYRPGIYRRLGDVSLFLTGVFPDYTQTHAFGPFDVARLMRAAGLSRDTGAGLSDQSPLQLLEYLGRRWYLRAGQLAPVTTVQLTVATRVAERFRDARRVLNHITDRYLSRLDDPWPRPPDR